MEWDRERRNAVVTNQYEDVDIDGDGNPTAVGFIEHRVSKMDTLAGVAIKYGVEVADIKRMNGLVTDLQMFALKSLHIPLPGRHPPSNLTNPSQDSSDQTSAHQAHPKLFESFHSLKLKAPQVKTSPAMTSFQGYHGLKPTNQKNVPEGFEMVACRRESDHYLEDGPFLTPSSRSNPPLRHHCKSKSVSNNLCLENGDLFDDVPVIEARDSDSDKWSDKLVRRRQKSEADFMARPPELLLKEDSSGGSAVSALRGKYLALRTNSAGRTAVVAETEGASNPIALGLCKPSLADSFSGVRKSSSLSNLQDPENSNSALRLKSKWSLMQDFQAFSSSAIARPIFDGLPKPTATRRKAALD
ncbi:hypothetical protein RJ641_003666 [Dillenia turbinata]|uniref:LysM domain-containing protein n=1 Tax=Dillenia turbinata TaxID=194707 RepID=A0AAN8VQ78_9MAGN